MPVTVDWQGQAPISGPAILTGGGRTTMLWCATQRDRANTPYADNSENARTARSIYLRGLREFSILRTNSPDAWRWRRIVFAVKGISAVLPIGSRFAAETNDQGWTRAMADYSGSASSNSRNSL